VIAAAVNAATLLALAVVIRALAVAVVVIIAAFVPTTRAYARGLFRALVLGRDRRGPG
jgi:hypothetical protein